MTQRNGLYAPNKAPVGESPSANDGTISYRPVQHRMVKFDSWNAAGKAHPDTFGVLSIYSTEINAYDDEEVALLRELAADLSFGILTHRSNLDRRRAETRVERLANYDLLISCSWR